MRPDIEERAELKGNALNSLLHVPTFTHDHELWVVTEGMTSWTLVADVNFLPQGVRTHPQGAG